jgi:trk system potassium uptake protein TrkA
MFVLIAGGGRTGAHLASLLLAQDHQVHVIEDREDVLSRLHRQLPTEVIFEGHYTDPELLVDAGIERAHVLAACTSDDAENLALCYYARARYGVPRTIARVNNPRTAWLFDEKFQVDAALNQPEILSTLIEEEMSLGDMVTLVKLRRGSYSLVEEKIPIGARAVGVSIKDIQLPAQSVIAGIIRHGEIVIPRGNTVFEVGDEVLAIVGHDSADDLAALFGRAPITPKP